MLVKHMPSMNMAINWCIILKSELESLLLLILKLTLCYSKHYCHFDLYNVPPVGKMTSVIIRSDICMLFFSNVQQFGEL